MGHLRPGEAMRLLEGGQTTDLDQANYVEEG